MRLGPGGSACFAGGPFGDYRKRRVGNSVRNGTRATFEAEFVGRFFIQLM